jgi:dTDP-4-dehydrorhamnose reductase
MLGHAVSEYFSRAQNEVLRIGRAEYDIARDPLEELERRLGDSRDVINCAGVIKPRVAAMSVEDVLKVNAIFPRNLARLCTATGRRLFHVTTDCAYSGSKGGYTEADYFDAEDVYGLTKNAG